MRRTGLFDFNFSLKTIAFISIIFIVGVILIVWVVTGNSNSVLLLIGAIIICISGIIIFQRPYWGIILVVLVESIRSFDPSITSGSFLTINKILVASTFVIYILKSGLLKLKIFNTPLDIPLNLLIVYAAISLLWSSNFDKGLDRVASLTSLYVLYFLTYRVCDSERKITKVVSAMIIFSLFLFFTLYIEKNQISDNQSYLRIGSTFGSPTIVGSWIVLIIGPVFARFIYWKKPLQLIIYGSFVLLSIYFLILSQSRGAWIGSLITLAFFLLKFNKMQKRQKMAIGVLIFVLTFLITTFETVIINRIQYFTTSRNDFNLRSSDILMGLHVFANHPIIGVGIGSYSDVSSEFKRELVDLSYAPGSAHNLYLAILAELGIIGFFLLGFIIHTLIRFQYTLSSKIGKMETDLRITFYGLSASLLGFSINSLFHNGLYFNILWIILGLYINLIRITIQKNRISL